MNNGTEALRELMRESRLSRQKQAELDAQKTQNSSVEETVENYKNPVNETEEPAKFKKLEVFGIEIDYDPLKEANEPEIKQRTRGRPRLSSEDKVSEYRLLLSRDFRDKIYAIKTNLKYKVVGISRRVRFLTDYYYSNHEKNKNRAGIIKRYIRPISSAVENAKTSQFDSSLRAKLESKYLELGNVLFFTMFDQEDIEAFFNKEEKFHIRIAQMAFTNKGRVDQ